MKDERPINQRAARVEILGQLYKQGASGGKIYLRKQDRTRALDDFGNDLKAYEKARRRVLRNELASYYRVAIFGSARLKEDDQDFRFVTRLTQALVEARGVDIVTGGGPGIMTAATSGLISAGLMETLPPEDPRRGKIKAKNVGITLSTLPVEEAIDGNVHLESRHAEFSTRLQDFLDKTMASYSSRGGIGTLLELLMLVQSKQVKHLEPGYPIIAHPCWRPVVAAWNEELYYRRKREERTTLIDVEDLELIKFSKNIPEIVDIISVGYDAWYDKIRKHVRVTR